MNNYISKRKTILLPYIYCIFNYIFTILTVGFLIIYNNMNIFLYPKFILNHYYLTNN